MFWHVTLTFCDQVTLGIGSFMQKILMRFLVFPRVGIEYGFDNLLDFGRIFLCFDGLPRYLRVASNKYTDVKFWLLNTTILLCRSPRQIRYLRLLYSETKIFSGAKNLLKGRGHTNTISSKNCPSCASGTRVTLVFPKRVRSWRSQASRPGPRRGITPLAVR